MKNKKSIALFLNELEIPQVKLPEADYAVFENMIAKWKTRRLGNGQQISSIEADIFVVRNMLNYVGKAPWHWSEEDFESFCEFIGVKKALSLATQRKYQCAIRVFFDYIVGNIRFKNEIRQNYGVELKQICNAENSIPHIVERELKKERLALTHNQIATLFDAMDLAIIEAVKFHSKNTKPLQRDKLLWYLTYTAGLRISEALSLNVTSFEPNPNFPIFGDFGFIQVWGKGSKGSGKKFRYVPVTHPNLPPLLEWYIKTIRPYFLMKADPNESALFLSERGSRLKKSTANARFHLAMQYSGLEEFNFTPHCLRHSSVTHESLRLSVDSVRRKHGHTFASTTQTYMHISDEMMNKEINHVINSQLDRILGATKEDKK